VESGGDLSHERGIRPSEARQGGPDTGILRFPSLPARWMPWRPHGPRRVRTCGRCCGPSCRPWPCSLKPDASGAKRPDHHHLRRLPRLHQWCRSRQTTVWSTQARRSASSSCIFSASGHGPGEARGVPDDGGQHLLEVERSGKRLCEPVHRPQRGHISPRSSSPGTVRWRPSRCASFSCVSFDNLRWRPDWTGGMRRDSGDHAVMVRPGQPGCCRCPRSASSAAECHGHEVSQWAWVSPAW
jgi:hypothetical protein